MIPDTWALLPFYRLSGLGKSCASTSFRRSISSPDQDRSLLRRVGERGRPVLIASTHLLQLAVLADNIYVFRPLGCLALLPFLAQLARSELRPFLPPNSRGAVGLGAFAIWDNLDTHGE